MDTTLSAAPRFGQFVPGIAKPMMAMIEVTNRCNMDCPVCFSDANNPSHDVPFAEVRHRLERLLAVTGSPIPIQISGGEPTVTLVAESRRGKGGRNQQLVLAAVEQLNTEDAAAIVILSAGTDGEDGPTDAAGALADSLIIAAASERNLDPADYLARNDAYHWFEPLGGLIKTGPTHTNVCDLRVVLVDRAEK